MNRLAAYFAQPVDPATGNGPGAAYYDPATNRAFRRAENPLLNGYNYAGNALTEPTGPGTSQHLYGADGGYTGERVRPSYGFMDNMIASSLPAFAMMAAPFVLPALGFGAGAAGAAAPAAAAAEGLTVGGPMSMGSAIGTDLGTLGSFSIPEGVAFAPSTAAEMASMGLAPEVAATTMGASAAPAAFNAAQDSQLANAAIQSAGGDALSGYTAAGIPSVTVNGAPTAGGIGSVLSNLFGHSGTNVIGDAAGGFNWGSLIGPALNAVGGIAGANAASSAADAQLQAAREAAALQEPFRQGTIKGMNRLLDLLGVSGNTGAEGYGSAARPFGMADFQADPGAEFRRQQGEQGLQRAASAAGGLGSGKFLKDAMSFNSGLASQEYGNAFNRFQTNRASVLNPLQSLMGAGQTAANTIADYGTQGANAQAAGKVGQANAWNNAIGQGYSMYQNSQQADQNRLFTNALMDRWARGN
jgi:hypothetical protein